MNPIETTVTMPWEILDRMERAVAKVRDRLLRATAVLNQAGIPYAVVGGHAVASWVATVDEGAVRNTPDVDLLVRREDFPAVVEALERGGFVRAEPRELIVFFDNRKAKPNESIHVLFAGEKIRPDDPLPAPNLTTIADPAGFHILTFEPLVHMKLLSHRLKDKVHIQDLIGVGLIDQTWLPKLPPVLAERLKAILDNPEN
jgi:Uncharacterised nucleotidyltransferase